VFVFEVLVVGLHASGGRMNAAATEMATTEQRTRAQAAFDQARTAMASLAPSRPVAEVEAVLAIAKPTCRVTVLNGKRDTFCTPNASLVAEKARAQRRVELQAQIERANAALSEAPARMANTDAVALAGYLAAVGIKTDADTLNKLLTLLGVLVIEVGGGLSLAVGMALSEKPLSEQTVHTAPVHSPGQHIKETPAASEETDGVHTVHSPSKSSRDRLLALVHDAQGALRTGHRALGEALGISATRAGQLLRDLVADGAIRVRAGKTGSVITLVPKLVAERG
jgi:hypothetical protein